MKNPLIEIVEQNEDKFFALFDQYGGRLSFEEKQGEKGDFLEVKVLNEQAQLAGIVWYFGPRRSYIEDIRLMVARKESQKIPMVLLAGEGTTSAGKKELKEADIKLLKDLEILKALPAKKKRKKSQKKQEDTVSIDDDVTITDVPDTPLIKIAQMMVKKREPEIIRINKIKNTEVDTYEVRGYTSNNDILAVYRTIDSDSIGVKLVRSFVKIIEDLGNVPVAIIGADKFTPSAKKEASEFNINLISEKQELETKGDEEQQLLNERLKNGAIDMIAQMGFVPVNKTDSSFMKLLAGNESLGEYITSENDKKQILLALLPSEEVVRVATVRQFKLQMEALKVHQGMIIPLKRFTYTAEREAKENQISVLKKNHPVFNIFNHYLVPDHELMTIDDIDNLLERYNAKLSQLPRIFEDDPGVVAVNGNVGDVVKIGRNHDNQTYRLVIPRPDTGITESTAMLDLVNQKKERMQKKLVKVKN